MEFLKKKNGWLIEKRGQVTLFVIVAIVAVVFIAGFFLLQGDRGLIRNFAGSGPAYDIVSFCVDEVTEDSLEKMGESGGYFDLPEKVNDLYMPYYFYEEENLMPSLEVIEGELEKYTETMLYFCLEKAFSETDSFEVVGGDIVVDVKIASDDTVSFVVDYPFTVFRGDTSDYFDKSLKRVYDVRLFTVYNFIFEMMQWQEKEPRAFCVNCIGDEAFDKKLTVTLFDIFDGDILFYVADNSSIVNDEVFSYYFIVKPVSGGDYDPFENL